MAPTGRLPVLVPHPTLPYPLPPGTPLYCVLRQRNSPEQLKLKLKEAVHEAEETSDKTAETFHQVPGQDMDGAGLTHPV